MYQAFRSGEYYIVITSDTGTTLYQQAKWNEEQKRKYGASVRKCIRSISSDDDKLRYYLYSSGGQIDKIYKIRIYEKKGLLGLDPLLQEIYLQKISEVK